LRVTDVHGSLKSSTNDVLEIVSWLIAVSLPPAVAPILMCCSVSGRAPTGPYICVRSRTSLTGTPASLEAIAASTTCDQVVPLQPKPRPTNGQTTRTISGAMPSDFEAVRRTPGARSGVSLRRGRRAYP
jgi:hypothetical protein